MEKRNVMKTGVLWNEVVNQVHAREFKGVELEHQLADSGGMQLVRNGRSSSTSSSPIICSATCSPTSPRC